MEDRKPLRLLILFLFILLPIQAIGYGYETHGYLASESVNLYNKTFSSNQVSGDLIFHQACRGVYDAVVAMYHDQALAPFKLLAFETGVNLTLGLPYVRTSPDHGTAYDIAYQGKASSKSMESAIETAVRLVLKR